MPQLSSAHFREILKNDDYTYVLTSKTTEPIDVNFPNMPSWHKDEFEEWRHEILPEADVVWFEYKGLNYKILRNAGDADCNDGNFGAVFDENNDKILDMLSSGDTETTMQALKPDNMKISDDLSTKLSPYLEFFRTVLHNNMEFEYLVFKILLENECFLLNIDEIDEQCGGD